MNLRYPDKSSNEYLEYLQNCTDDNKDSLFLLGNNWREKHLYEKLVEIVGTELDIRNKQRLCIIYDRIFNACDMDPSLTQISSGSLAEGMALQDSDIDTMYVINQLELVQDERNIKHPINRDVLVMETDNDHPGFTRIRLVAQTDRNSLFSVQCFCPPNTCSSKFYLSVNDILEFYMEIYEHVCIHGPCISNISKTEDIAYCIRSKHLPHDAIPWATRHRWQWPPNVVIDKIISYGCLLVPIGPKTISNIYLWRFSFSVAEKILVYSFNFTQLLCYGLLKLTFKRIVNADNDIKDLVCSYFLKTALFWVSEEVDIETFQLPKLFYCFSLCLDKLISWVKICYCPNYFIHGHNMFDGTINESNSKTLMCALDNIKRGGIDVLLISLFPLENEIGYLLRTKRESSFVILDCLFYKISNRITVPNDISVCHKYLSFTEPLIMSELSTFITDVCKYHNAKISQILAQLLPPAKSVSNPYNIHKRYHKHLMDGIKTDAVSGWLLYASFYYITGQFNVTLRLTDYVLSRCSPDMMCKDDDYHCEKHRNCYQQNVHSLMTLNERMKMATIANVKYIKHSSLIPSELKLEVEDEDIQVPPNVMSHCLRYLCFRHLGDLINTQQALRDLYLIVTDNCIFKVSHMYISLLILGVCYEISGDKDRAYQCYEEAVQRNRFQSSIAAVKRISKLDCN
ncbi:Hypothetical predicted protein [Mytilus galloprovincialis]|uniref:Mab-21-like HhH/H2TH-like domain-containing protein n=1 Tax=Mytilus galloprovincialis TaxID=29158 RepID=A0A8B6HE50_MYTGA|nr:Hypothetical predicted protein [Mytilus galloprovincialis]